MAEQQMIEQLEQLSLAVGAIRREDVNQVADAVNRRLLDLVGAQVVKLYWRIEAQDGIILEPVASISSTGKEPKPFQVPQEPNGVLSWVYREKRPLWLTRLKSRNLDRDPIPNLACDDGEMVPQERLDVEKSPELDCVMAVPVFERGDVHGVYSVEAFSSEKFNSNLLELIQRIASALSPLLWNADVYSYDLEKSSRAVSKFLTANRNFKFDPILIAQKVKTAFIARPFEDPFPEVEEALCKLLVERGIEGRHYVSTMGRGVVLDDIFQQVENAHFSICDLTRMNINVVAEVVVGHRAHKPLLLIRDGRDTTELPFDLPNLPIHGYYVDENKKLYVNDPAARNPQSFADILDRFISNLPIETGFHTALNFRP
jgi:GAF domain-containing protein